MLPSGNDAAYCLAEYFGQYLKDNKYQDQNVTSLQFNWSIVRFFLKEMNLYAFKLRMFSSQFDSPHGLANKWNLSTAADVCLLAAKCMEIPRFRRVVSTQTYSCQAIRQAGGKKPTQYNWENTNKLLGTDGFIGCKTGITDPAGPCFCGGYEKGNDKYIVVVLNSKSMEQRWIEVPKIVDWAVRKQRAQDELKDKYFTRDDS
jgi:D-alanyl-D-alanine carboxypeptidase